MLQRERDLGRLLTVITRVCKYARSFSEAEDMRKKKKVEFMEICSVSLNVTVRGITTHESASVGSSGLADTIEAASLGPSNHIAGQIRRRQNHRQAQHASCIKWRKEQLPAYPKPWWASCLHMEPLLHVELFTNAHRHQSSLSKLVRGQQIFISL
jgi:hypothetical protein